MANGSTKLSSVYFNHNLIGFLLDRGKSGVEAFTPDEISLGVFPTATASTNAVSDAVEPISDIASASATFEAGEPSSITTTTTTNSDASIKASAMHANDGKLP